MSTGQEGKEAPMSIALTTMFAAVSSFGHAQHADARDHRPAQSEQRRDNDRRIVDHRPARPIVRDHREPARTRPVIVRDHREVVVDHDYAPAYVPSAYSAGYTYAPQPTTLLGAAALDGRIQIDTTGKLGGDGTLKIVANDSGSTFIQQVALYYTGGGSQLVTVQRTLDANNPVFEIPLGNGASLGGVVIDGHSLWGNAISVTAC
jgi:hypothetical protein